MGHLFLDIETYSSKQNPDTSLNPYLDGAKVIVIAYNYYNSFKPPGRDEVKPPVFLLEWESSEKAILSRFYDFLRETKRSDPYLKIIGFNITKFDLPFLFGRMSALKIGAASELHNLLFRPFGIDLFQLSPIISEKTRQHEQLWGINHKDVSSFFKLQQKEANGLDCSRFYDAKQYNKLMEYCTQEFNFEQMLDCFYLHVIKNLQK